VITTLHLENLSVGRGERVLFERLGLVLNAGEAVSLTGANGSGKTTLLRAIAGLVRPLVGRVWFAGGADELDAEEARGKGLHLLGHQDGLKTTRTAREEQLFQALWTGGTEASAADAMKALDLEGVADLEVRMLSAGQRRRLALSRLIASPRPLWLLDEPLAPLDAHRRARFGEIMAAHLKGGGLILAAVHDPLPIPTRALEIGT
jgi:heme exporter protein A